MNNCLRLPGTEETLHSVTSMSTRSHVFGEPCSHAWLSVADNQCSWLGIEIKRTADVCITPAADISKVQRS